MSLLYMPPPLTVNDFPNRTGMNAILMGQGLSRCGPSRKSCTDVTYGGDGQFGAPLTFSFRRAIFPIWVSAIR
jgi:hypothetical protein